VIVCLIERLRLCELGSELGGRFGQKERLLEAWKYRLCIRTSGGWREIHRWQVFSRSDCRRSCFMVVKRHGHIETGN